ncbi:CHASE3 domain-containing protein [Xanthomonas axonopodis pv. vasculorum]|nr:CHASE3 domain-containing protein [Xanthomonas axonopodis pv. vasculorum]
MADHPQKPGGRHLAIAVAGRCIDGHLHSVERQNIAAENDVRQTLEVLSDLYEAHALLAETAAGVRGYRLVRRDEFLTPYRDAESLGYSAWQTVFRNVSPTPAKRGFCAHQATFCRKNAGLAPIAGTGSEPRRRDPATMGRQVQTRHPACGAARVAKLRNSAIAGAYRQGAGAAPAQPHHYLERGDAGRVGRGICGGMVRLGIVRAPAHPGRQCRPAGPRPAAGTATACRRRAGQGRAASGASQRTVGRTRSRSAAGAARSGDRQPRKNRISLAQQP